MSKQPQYNTIAREAFDLYLDNKIDLDALIERLRYIELQVQAEDESEEENDKELWFCFFEGDSLKTTIRDIEKELRDPSHPSANILRRGIALGLEAKELDVHYS